MRRWTRSALVHVMSCRLIGDKQLPEPMRVYCQVDSREQISVKFESKLSHLFSRKCIWNCRLPTWRPFWTGGDGWIGLLVHGEKGWFIDERVRAVALLDSDTLVHEPAILAMIRIDCPRDRTSVPWTGLVVNVCGNKGYTQQQKKHHTWPQSPQMR